MVDGDDITERRQLVKDFGRDWSIWQSHDLGGRRPAWYANRLGDLLTYDEMHDGLHHTVAGDTAAEFRVVLVEQYLIEALRYAARVGLPVVTRDPLPAFTPAYL